MTEQPVNAKILQLLFISEPLLLKMILFQIESYIVYFEIRMEDLPELVLKIHEVVQIHSDFLKKLHISCTQVMKMAEMILLIAHESRLYRVADKTLYDHVVKTCMKLLEANPNASTAMQEENVHSHFVAGQRVYIPPLELKRMPEQSKLVHIPPPSSLPYKSLNNMKEFQKLTQADREKENEKENGKEKEKEKRKEDKKEEEEDDDVSSYDDSTLTDDKYVWKSNHILSSLFCGFHYKPKPKPRK